MTWFHKERVLVRKGKQTLSLYLNFSTSPLRRGKSWLQQIKIQI